jgi:hypothetical protein
VGEIISGTGSGSGLTPPVEQLVDQIQAVVATIETTGGTGNESIAAIFADVVAASGSGSSDASGSGSSDGSGSGSSDGYADPWMPSSPFEEDVDTMVGGAQDVLAAAGEDEESGGAGEDTIDAVFEDIAASEGSFGSAAEAIGDAFDASMDATPEVAVERRTASSGSGSGAGAAPAAEAPVEAETPAASSGSGSGAAASAAAGAAAGAASATSGSGSGAAEIAGDLGDAIASLGSGSGSGAAEIAGGLGDAIAALGSGSGSGMVLSSVRDTFDAIGGGEGTTGDESIDPIFSVITGSYTETGNDAVDSTFGDIATIMGDANDSGSDSGSSAPAEAETPAASSGSGSGAAAEAEAPAAAEAAAAASGSGSGAAPITETANGMSIDDAAAVLGFSTPDETVAASSGSGSGAADAPAEAETPAAASDSDGIDAIADDIGDFADEAWDEITGSSYGAPAADAPAADAPAVYYGAAEAPAAEAPAAEAPAAAASGSGSGAAPITETANGMSIDDAAAAMGLDTPDETVAASSGSGSGSGSGSAVDMMMQVDSEHATGARSISMVAGLMCVVGMAILVSLKSQQRNGYKSIGDQVKPVRRRQYGHNVDDQGVGYQHKMDIGNYQHRRPSEHSVGDYGFQQSIREHSLGVGNQRQRIHVAHI